MNTFRDLGPLPSVAGDESNLLCASAEQIAQALLVGTCPSDSSFDQLLSERVRELSPQHWSPLAVALRAAQWFEEYGVRTVVDIGSGPGKFCIAAALSGRCHFTGLEHREHLVTCARALARTFDVENRVHFLQGALGSVRMPAADAYYLYNPFEENVLRPEQRIDDSVELTDERQARDLETVRKLLMDARPGTFVLIYNGFGARLPPSYAEVCTDRELPNILRFWRKISNRAARARSANLGEASAA